MRKKIEQKYKIGCAFKILTIVVGAVFFGTFFTLPYLSSEESFPIVYGIAMLLFALVIAYLCIFSNIMKSVKLLKDTDTMDMLDIGFDDEHYLPKSKIYYNAKGIFSKKPWAAIPYSEIAWIFVRKKKMYGLVTVSTTLIIKTRNGKEFILNSNPDEFNILLQNHILRINPNIIAGYSPDREKAYKQIVKEYKNSKGK